MRFVPILLLLSGCVAVEVIPGEDALWDAGPCEYEPGALRTNRPDLLPAFVAAIQATALAWPSFGPGTYHCPSAGTPLAITAHSDDIMATEPGHIITGLTTHPGSIRILLDHPGIPRIDRVSRSALVHELVHRAGWLAINDPAPRHAEGGGWWTVRTDACIDSIDQQVAAQGY